MTEPCIGVNKHGPDQISKKQSAKSFSPSKANGALLKAKY